MRILYVGSDQGTSGLRFHALSRVGHSVDMVNPRDAFRRSRYADLWLWRFGGFGLDRVLEAHLDAKIGRRTWDLVWVDSGEFVGPRSLRRLRAACGAAVCFNYDNPFAARDGRRWRLLLAACEDYDLFVTPRDSSAEAALRAGARRAFRCFQCADEVGDRPLELAEFDVSLKSEVMFAGYWFNDELRCEFLLQLAARGLGVSVWGNRWEKSPNWAEVSKHWRGPVLVGRRYHAAIGASKVSLGLLSRGNHDLHTTRSVEITYTGGVLCAEHTVDHALMYENWKEAVLWRDVDECAEACRRLIAEPDLREEIRLGGMRRVRELGLTNESLLAQILRFLEADASASIGRFAFKG